MTRLAHPWVLLLGLVPLAAWAWSRHRERRRLRGEAGAGGAGGAPDRATGAGHVVFSETTTLEAVARGGGTRLPGLIAAAGHLGLALAVVALARPQAGWVEERVIQEGIDIAVVLDISSSMRAEDFAPENRLAVAKEVTKRFVEGREGDRIALVVFAAEALTKCPLVLDPAIVTALVDEVGIGELEDGTAIGTAIATGLNRLKAGTGDSRVMILLTDGVNTAGEMAPLETAELAAPFGVRIHTVGVGTDGLVPVPVIDRRGRVMRQMRPVEIDEETLLAVAERTGGTYHRATDAEALAAIFAELDALETSPAETSRITHHRELFPWLLLPALVLVAVAETLARTAFRVVP